MKQAYPIVLTRTGGFFAVHVPDMQIDTQGKDLPEALEMARDAIEMTGVYLEDQKRDVPPPSSLNEITKERESDILTLVDVDFDAYRRRTDQRTVRRNVALPSWLNERASDAGINVSAVLQRALKQELHITD